MADQPIAPRDPSSPGIVSTGPEYDASTRWKWLGLLIVGGLVVRLLFRDALPRDMTEFVVPWYRQLAERGYRALGDVLPGLHGQTNLNYTPPYYYLLYLATGLDSLMPAAYSTKLVSEAFSYLAAFFMYRLVRLRYPSGPSPWLAASCVVFAPTVIANGAWWGQCDSIPASLLLGSLYFLLRGKNVRGVLLFGVALSFKAQAVFFAPFLLMLVLSSELSLGWLLLIPATYGAMMLPAILLGRATAEVFTVILRQADVYHRLSMNAPNLYHLLPNAYYGVMVPAGMVLTTLACSLLAALPRWTGTKLPADRRVLAATMFVALAPFLLPKMHDRYFFFADMLSIALAFYIPGLWLVPVLFQVSSMLAYGPIISRTMNGHMVTATIPPAALLNTILVGFLVVLHWRSCRRPEEGVGGAGRRLSVLAVALMGTLAMWLVVAWTYAHFEPQLCAASGWITRLCGREFPADLRLAGIKHWALLAVLFSASWGILERTFTIHSGRGQVS